MGNFIRRREFIMGAASCAATFSSFARSLRSGSASVISVADFGALPNGKDAGPGVRMAIAQLPSRGGATLYFPPGAYRFALRSETLMNFNGIEGFQIQGDGARFLFEGTPRPIAMVNCPGAQLRGFTIDWVRPPFSHGEIIQVDPAGRVADVRIDPEFPVDGSERVKALATYERDTALMAVNGIDAYDIVDKLDRVGEQRLRLWFNRPLPLHTGDTLLLRHEVYGTNAINIDRCQKIKLVDITIHAAPGMAILGTQCRNISLQNVRVLPTPGSRRLMSTTADAVHLALCSGKIDIRDCLLTAMGDDCINAHGNYLQIQRIMSARNIAVGLSDYVPIPKIELIPKGDHVEFVSANTLEDMAEAAVVDAQAGASENLKLADDLPANVHPGDYLFDTSLRPLLTVSRCNFPGNRARGVLAHSDAVIEHCHFANQTLEAVLLTTNARGEGPAADRVSIRDNVVEDVLRSSSFSGAIRIGAFVIDGAGKSQPSKGMVNHSLEIVNNRIRSPDRMAIYASATMGLRIERNRIEGSNGQPAIFINYVKNALIKENTCDPERGLRVTNCESVKTQNNHGLALTSS
jgi:hypothetical protein